MVALTGGRVKDAGFHREPQCPGIRKATKQFLLVSLEDLLCVGLSAHGGATGPVCQHVRLPGSCSCSATLHCCVSSSILTLSGLQFHLQDSDRGVGCPLFCSPSTSI